ncbi:MAG: hypothetical protein JNM72_24315, partial [Deltaproteobacteria bacterium]|nr:hypothetical protein [Deltaproteobacteria bacterium]
SPAQRSADDGLAADQIPNENKGLVAEFIGFIIHNKAWWMTPILVVLALMIGFILYVEGSPVLPFIYALI